MKRIDTKRLAKLAGSSPEAKMVMQFLATRERDSRTTNLRVFAFFVQQGSGKPLKNREAFDSVWDELEKLGIGGVVRSKRGVPTHYDWQGYSARSVGIAALDPSKHPVMSTFRTSPSRKLKKEHAKATGKSKVSHFVDQKGTISADEVFANFGSEGYKLEVKDKFSKKDKEKLLKLVRSLPVEAE